MVNKFFSAGTDDELFVTGGGSHVPRSPAPLKLWSALPAGGVRDHVVSAAAVLREEDLFAGFAVAAGGAEPGSGDVLRDVAFDSGRDRDGGAPEHRAVGLAAWIRAPDGREHRLPRQRRSGEQQRGEHLCLATMHYAPPSNGRRRAYIWWETGAGYSVWSVRRLSGREAWTRGGAGTK